MCTYIYIYVCVYIFTYICITYIYIYMYIYIYTAGATDEARLDEALRSPQVGVLGPLSKGQSEGKGYADGVP